MKSHGIRVLIVVTVSYLVAAGVMFGLMMPAVRGACGTGPLDSLFSWDRATADSFVRGCGVDGLATYWRLATLDVVYPALLGATVAGWILWLGRRLAISTPLLTALVALPILGALADYAENIAIWGILSGSAGPDGFLNAGGTFSSLKDVLGSLGGVTLVFLGALALVRGIRARRDGYRPRASLADVDAR